MTNLFDGISFLVQANTKKDEEEVGTAERKKIPLIGIAAAGYELDKKNLELAVEYAAAKGCKAVIIDGDDCHAEMERMLKSGEIDGAVASHYPFPIGVSTVGKVFTPAFGKEMFIACTTGTSSTDRAEGLVKNAIYGIIAAKCCGIADPSVGIINLDDARRCERALKKLKANGYKINFAESCRADGGVVMRGNDVIRGTADVMVCDPLTGNLLMKLFSSFNTGGDFEATGFGYGPGIGEGYGKLVLIISRASGAPVIANAVEYASRLVDSDWIKLSHEEFRKADAAGYDDILAEIRSEGKNAFVSDAPKVTAPPKETCTAEIPGIEVMDIEDAVQSLWAEDVYAESGMGCTGPVVLVAEARVELARKLLIEKGYISEE
ncbi:MAG: glycine reductase [Clostridiales bacterium]|nr:glycine reductase [Clostridiales bacterium]